MVYILPALRFFVYEYRIMVKAYGNISSFNLTPIWAKLRYLIGSHMWTIDQNKYAKGNGENDIVRRRNEIILNYFVNFGSQNWERNFRAEYNLTFLLKLKGLIQEDPLIMQQKRLCKWSFYRNIMGIYHPIHYPNT